MKINIIVFFVAAILVNQISYCQISDCKLPRINISNLVKYYILSSVINNAGCTRTKCVVTSESTFTMDVTFNSLKPSQFLSVEGTIGRSLIKNRINEIPVDGCSQMENFCPWRERVRKTMTFSFKWPRVNKPVI